MVLLAMVPPSRQRGQVLLQVHVVPAVPVFLEHRVGHRLAQPFHGLLVDTVELEGAAGVVLQRFQEERQVFVPAAEGLQEEGLSFRLDLDDEEPVLFRPPRMIIIAPDEQVRIGAFGPHMVRFVEVRFKNGAVFHGHIFKW